MDCYDAKWCPEQECEICDYWIGGYSGWPFVWRKVRQFFVRLWRRDFRAGYVYMGLGAKPASDPSDRGREP